MPPRLFSLLVHVGALGLLVIAFIVFINIALPTAPAPTPLTATSTQTAGVSTVRPATTTSATSTSAVQPPATTTPPKKPAAATIPAAATTSPRENEVFRIQNPYPVPPKTVAEVNDGTRAALVNILCMPRAGGLRPISGSGVIIDPRGVILTNAHVAQYVMLSQSPSINLTCTIRTGAPARAQWVAEVLYISPAWVREHAKDISVEKPTGTGKHDYALLHITGSLNGPLPATFPYIPADVREAIAFTDDTVLVASYPAEFVGGITAQQSLHPVSSITAIRELLTLQANTVDLVSLGGVIGAQSGSSGGAVANWWGYLVGIITTTSEGATTDKRDLRALTLAYINRDLKEVTGMDLATMLSGDIAAQAAHFKNEQMDGLIQLIVDNLKR